MKKEVKDTIIVDLGEKLKEFPHFSPQVLQERNQDGRCEEQASAQGFRGFGD